MQAVEIETQIEGLLDITRTEQIAWLRANLRDNWRRLLPSEDVVADIAGENYGLISTAIFNSLLGNLAFALRDAAMDIDNDKDWWAELLEEKQDAMVWIYLALEKFVRTGYIAGILKIQDSLF